LPRGVIYMLVGVLALDLAVGHGDREASRQGRCARSRGSRSGRCC
jgi:hypothetical protein